MSEPKLNSVAVKISKRNYRRIRESCKKYGHSVSWYVNYAIDMRFQEDADSRPKFEPHPAKTEAA